MSLRYISCSDFSEFAGFCQRVWGAGWWDLQSRRAEQSASNGWLFKWPKGDQASEKDFCPNCFHTRCLSRFILNRFIKSPCSKNSRIPPHVMWMKWFFFLPIFHMKFMPSWKWFTNASIYLFIWSDGNQVQITALNILSACKESTWTQLQTHSLFFFVFILTRWPWRFHDIFCCVWFFFYQFPSFWRNAVISNRIPIFNFPNCSNLK